MGALLDCLPRDAISSVAKNGSTASKLAERGRSRADAERKATQDMLRSGVAGSRAAANIASRDAMVASEASIAAFDRSLAHLQSQASVEVKMSTAADAVAP